MNNKEALILWVLFLSCIIIPAAVIVNFNIGTSQFQLDLAGYTGSLTGGVK